MDSTYLDYQSQPTFLSAMATLDALGEVMVYIMSIYLLLLALAIPPVLASLSLTAFIFESIWVLLRNVIWRVLRFYISWVTTISAFLIFGPGSKSAVLMVLVVFWGFIPTTLLILVVLTAPLGYILLQAYLYTGIVLCSGILLVDYMMMMWQEQPDAVIASVLGILVAFWAAWHIWECYCQCAAGAAHLAEVKRHWQEEDAFWVIVREEFEGRMEGWLVREVAWWENLFWRHHVW